MISDLEYRHQDFVELRQGAGINWLLCTLLYIVVRQLRSGK